MRKRPPQRKGALSREQARITYLFSIAFGTATTLWMAHHHATNQYIFHYSVAEFADFLGEATDMTKIESALSDTADRLDTMQPLSGATVLLTWLGYAAFCVAAYLAHQFLPKPAAWFRPAITYSAIASGTLVYTWIMCKFPLLIYPLIALALGLFVMGMLSKRKLGGDQAA